MAPSRKTASNVNSLEVKLQGQSGIRTLLTLSPVPSGLHTVILRAFNRLKEHGSPGFPQVVRDNKSSLLTITFPDVEGALPDRVRYYYRKDGTIIAKTARTLGKHNLPVGAVANTQPSSTYKDKSVVLMLESPHTDEMQHRQPAAGATGERIDARLVALGEVLKPLVDRVCPDPQWSELPVVITNPCPYPTSCLASTTSWGSLRDLVFSRVFPEVEAEFGRRLMHYNPLVIINACTDGAEPGHILKRVNARFRIEEGHRPPIPKSMVANAIDNWIGQDRCFDRRTFSNDRDNNTFKEKPAKRSSCEGRPLEGVLLDFGHPLSWITRTAP